MEKFVSEIIESKTLGVHQRTLYLWDKKKIIETIRTPGGKRLYNVKKYLESLEKIHQIINSKLHNKNNYIYARVSSKGQKNDLERQIKVLLDVYSEYTLIREIGSGMNLNRKGLIKIIDEDIKGHINEVVIVHKDRLCKFGYELVEDIIHKYSNGKIKVIENNPKKEIKEELVDDVLQIMNIFVAKINGMRKYNKTK